MHSKKKYRAYKDKQIKRPLWKNSLITFYKMYKFSDAPSPSKNMAYPIIHFYVHSCKKNAQ